MSDMELKNQSISANEAEDEFEIDLMEMLLRMVERWKLIVAGALVGAVIMFVYSFIIATPQYEATSKLYVLSSSDSAINLSDLQIGSYLTSDYVEVFDTWEVHDMVRRNLQLNYSDEKLKDMLTLKNPTNTRVLYITIRSGDPKEAMTLSNEYASVARQYISAAMQTDEPSIMSEAKMPEEPVAPHKARNMIIGILIGAIIMCVAVVVQYLLDDKVKTEDDVKKYTGLPTLAIVPDNDEAAMEDRRNQMGKSGNTDRRPKK